MKTIDQSIFLFFIIDIVAIVLTAHNIVTNYTASAAASGFAMGTATASLIYLMGERR